MVNPSEDKYELKCQSTDDERQLNDKKDHVLIPEKDSANVTKYTNTKSNIISLSILSIFFVIILYFLFKFVIKKIGLDSNTIMKGGKRYKLKIL